MTHALYVHYGSTTECYLLHSFFNSLLHFSVDLCDFALSFFHLLHTWGTPFFDVAPIFGVAYFRYDFSSPTQKSFTFSCPFHGLGTSLTRLDPLFVNFKPSCRFRGTGVFCGILCGWFVPSHICSNFHFCVNNFRFSKCNAFARFVLWFAYSPSWKWGSLFVLGPGGDETLLSPFLPFFAVQVFPISVSFVNSLTDPLCCLILITKTSAMPSRQPLPLVWKFISNNWRNMGGILSAQKVDF